MTTGSTCGGAGLELRALRKGYGRGAAPAVDGVSATVAPGEFFSLLGPSGCGKTTTLRMIAGFEAPDAGQILLNGRDITAAPPERRGMGMVFQNYALFPHRTVAENVGFGLRMRGVNRSEATARVREALALVRLTGLEDRRPAELSGGQQQRVALARAVVIRPAVLLCDEPLGALDKKLRQAMQFELKALHRQLGLTLVYVTHDQEEALTMSDRVAVMGGGRIVQCAPPREIYDHPRSRFVAEFIGDINILRGEVRDGALRMPGGWRLPLPRQGSPDGGLLNGTLPDGAMPDGSLPATTPGAGSRGGAAGGLTVALRPERVQLVPAGEGLVDARVEETNFLGDSVLLKLVLPQGDPLLVRAPRAQGLALTLPGTVLGVSCASEHLVPLDEGD